MPDDHASAEAVVSQTPTSGTLTPPKPSRPFLNGAMFVLTFAASAGVAWAFFPKAPAPRPPEKQEAKVDDKAKLREAELLERVEHLETELARKATETMRPEPKLIDSIPDVPVKKKAVSIMRVGVPVRDESKPTWSLVSSTQSGTSATSSNWPPGDVESASRVLRAIRAQDAAWSICKNLAMVGPPYQYLRIDAPCERGEFIAYMEKASIEAKLARPETLRRMHPDLPRAWQDFIIGSYAIAWSVRTGQVDRAGTQAWEQYSVWHKLHASEVRLPPGAKNW